MIKILDSRYKNSDFVKIQGSLVKVDLETDFVKQEDLTCSPCLKEGEKKKVFACVADNMRLPFPDSHFDCYISNLSLMIVPDYKRQLTECFRVLKSGSKACFAVWGRPENTV